MITALIVYLSLINLIAFALCVYDKRAAIAHRRRIPEKTLFVVAIIGGAAGFWLGMLLVRHKTRQPRFFVVMPLLILIHASLLVWLLV